MKRTLLLAAANSALLFSSCQDKAHDKKTEVPIKKPTIQPTKESKPTVQDVEKFLTEAETELVAQAEEGARVSWINANFITYDTDWLATKVGERGALLDTRLANEAKRFKPLTLPDDIARKIDSIIRASDFPAPDKPGAAAELSKIMTEMNSTYAKGKFEFKSTDPQFAHLYKGRSNAQLSLGELSEIIAKSRNPTELQTVWEGWRQIAPPMKKSYVRMTEIINEGSSELGFENAGALWRAGYDMPADDFTKESDRLWGQVKPLYDELHCHVRAKLNEKYGNDIVPLDKPIRADLLGNMWAQSWDNIFDLVAPNPKVPPVNVTALLQRAKFDAKKLVKTGENFFTSLGFEPLPTTFWERSLFLKPADREVVCHASAWDLDDQDDVRVKMCIKVDGEDFETVHHELGHNFYQRAYKDQPVFYKTGAHDGFHEAIGDMIALSLTPNYLAQIGLMKAKDLPSPSADLNLLMRQALKKIAFLPFGLLVDQWRWKVFSGEYSPADYNSGWWQLREKYQGLRAPGDRPSGAFDPGSKYHVPGNTPYMRYFLAHILQYQFHQAACKIAGDTGPLHRCSIYGNKDVGSRFNDMLKMGASKPWPEALKVFTGTDTMDGSAIIAYFAPLMDYLKEQNKDRSCGWK